MFDFKPYYQKIELDNGMVRIYERPHVADLAHLDSACGTNATAAYYFISRYLDMPIDGEKVLSEIFDRMYQKSVELGGLVSGEHGIGYAKKEFLKRQYGETPIALMQGIKKVFDEKNILNPGKVCF